MYTLYMCTLPMWYENILSYLMLQTIIMLLLCVYREYTATIQGMVESSYKGLAGWHNSHA